MKIVLELSFEVDGRAPSIKELDDIAAQMHREWATYVFVYGDDDDGALILREISSQWEVAQEAMDA